MSSWSHVGSSMAERILRVLSLLLLCPSRVFCIYCIVFVLWSTLLIHTPDLKGKMFHRPPKTLKTQDCSARTVSDFDFEFLNSLEKSPLRHLSWAIKPSSVESSEFRDFEIAYGTQWKRLLFPRPSTQTWPSLLRVVPVWAAVLQKLEGE